MDEITELKTYTCNFSDVTIVFKQVGKKIQMYLGKGKNPVISFTPLETEWIRARIDEFDVFKKVEKLHKEGSCE